MHAKTIVMHVAEAIVDEVSALSKSTEALRLEISTWKTSKTEWQEDLLLLHKGSTYTMALVSSDWYSTLQEDYPPRLLEAFHGGTIFIAFLGDVPKALPPFPCLFLPIHRGEAVLKRMLCHLSRTALPGVQSIFSEKAVIFSERLRSDRLMGTKIDKVIDFMNQRGYTLGAKSMRARHALSTALSAAFEERKKSNLQPYTITLQLGASEQVIAFSIRWKTEDLEVKDWSNPSSLWKPIPLICDAFWFHLIPEASEVEAIFLFTSEEPDALDRKSEPPLGVGLMTKTRLSVAARDPQALEMEHLAFRAVKDLPKPKDDNPDRSTRRTKKKHAA